MGKIKVSSCETDGMVIEGLHVIEPTVFNDERGYFMETYNQNDFKDFILRSNHEEMIERQKWR